MFQNSTAQKVMLVNQSPLTGIILPEGSKLDKRMLCKETAKLLLEQEGKKSGVSLSNVEVLTLPPFTITGYSEDSIIAAAQNAGWTISAASEENNYFWMEQKGKYILGYLSTSKKETNIFFGESNKSAQVRNVANTQIEIEAQTVAQTHTTADTQQSVEQPIQENTISNSFNGNFKFQTSNFDDGWTATEQADWVEVTKADIKVLLHYPKEGTMFSADPEPLTIAAWNILVSPRYSDLKAFKTSYITEHNRPYLGMGYAKENATGREVFVLLFNQRDGWIEVVTADKNSFIQQYKFDPEMVRWDSESDILIPLKNMSRYNRFAVDAADFKGKWTSDFSGIQQMYNVYTNAYAGMQINQSKEEFLFGNGGSYNWKLLVVDGMVGNTKYNQVKSSGLLNVPNNWQVHFSDIEKSPKTYHAFWACIKGARILNLLNADSPRFGIYNQYGLAK